MVSLRIPAFISSMLSLFTLEVLLHQFLDDLSNVLDEFVAVLFSTFLEVSRNLLRPHTSAPMVSPLASPGHTQAFMVSKSTTPMKSFSAPIGQLHDQRLGAQTGSLMVSTVK